MSRKASTPSQPSTPSTARPAVKLTRKQKVFADTLISKPKISATKAALVAYGSPEKLPTYASARQIATENMTKPSILQYLQLHSYKAENVLIDLLDSKQEPIKLRAATEVLDRTVGKPQSIQQVTQVGSINIQFGNGQ